MESFDEPLDGKGEGGIRNGRTWCPGRWYCRSGAGLGIVDEFTLARVEFEIVVWHPSADVHLWSEVELRSPFIH